MPTSLSQVAYPASYKIPTARVADINTDPCKLDFDVVTYPQSWIGSHPLPPVTGAPLASSLGRVVELKDIMLSNNPAFVLKGAPGAPANGCTGSLQSEFTKTINRLKLLGVDTVMVPQWHWATVNGNGSYGILPAESSFGPLTDADLAGFVQKAHAVGMKVLMLNQIGGFVDNQGLVATPPSNATNYGLWLTAFRAFSLQRAAYFQSIGIDIWEVGCAFCVFFDGNQNAPAQFASGYQSILSDISGIYTGKKLTWGVGWLASYPTFLAGIDIIKTNLWYDQLTPQQESALTVGALKAMWVTNGSISALQAKVAHGKPILIMSNIQSRANALSLPGYVEESNCTADLNLQPVSQTTCIQRETAPDFSLQAIYLEASLETIQIVGLPAGSMVGISDYWATDSLMPATAYPNIGSTIRNKPAEGLVKQWFAR